MNPGKFLMFFLKNPRLTVLALIAVVMTGVFGLLTVDVEANPEVNQPMGVIQTFYPNSTPQDVERQVTEPIEKEVAGLGKVKEITSSSTSNLSSVTVTFESNEDPDDVIDKLNEAANKVGPTLPNEAETPQVIEFDFNNLPIVTLSLAGPQSKLELSELSEEIQDEIKQIPNVSKVEVSGDVNQSVKIILDQQKLETHGITLTQVIQSIGASNLNAPLGSITKNSNELNLRLTGKISSLENLSKTPIRTIDQGEIFSTITLNQLGTVEFSTDKNKTDSFVSDTESQAENAVTLNVFKRSGGNIIKIVDQVDNKIEELNKELPEGTKIIKTTDNAYFIRTDIKTLSKSGAQTILIIFLALMIFLTVIEAFVAALAIPIIFLITFGTVYFTGQTLNSLTIFSLILSLGLIVDTSIVIVEGIHDNRKEGHSPFEASKLALAKYKWSLVAGTATTIAAFAPMLLVSGVVGDFIKTIPIVLTITLASSLLVSFIFTPLLASKLLGKKKSKKTFRDNLVKFLKGIYGRTIRTILHSGLLKSFIVLATLIAFAISVSLPFTGVLKAQLFPIVDVPYMYINIEAPQGTTLEETRELIKPLEEKISSYNAVDTYVLTTGRLVDTGFGLGTTTVKSSFANITVNLLENVDEREQSFELAEKLRNDISELNTPLEITLEELSSGPPTAAPFEARIIGSDLKTLNEISNELKSEIQKIDGFINVNSDFDESPEEVHLDLNQDLLNYYGISNQQVAQILQAYSIGIDTGNIEIDSEEYDIKIFFNDTETKDINQLGYFPVTTRLGNISLSQLGNLQTQKTINVIPHIDEKRSVRVRANLEKGTLLPDVLPKAEQAIENMQLPTGYSVELGGEDEEIRKSFTELFSSMIIAVILILTILVMIFNSFRQTFIVLASLPLATIGIFPGLAALGLPLSFPAFLGVVMLTGIVVNDAIVLMDQINKNRNTMPVNQAIYEGTKSRLVPILLTSITTIFGLLPITFQDEFWEGLGYSVIFGLIAATFLTLFIIPILYSLFYGKQQRLVE